MIWRCPRSGRMCVADEQDLDVFEVEAKGSTLFRIKGTED